MFLIFGPLRSEVNGGNFCRTTEYCYDELQCGPNDCEGIISGTVKIQEKEETESGIGDNYL